jgi:hypothetical protein
LLIIFYTSIGSPYVFFHLIVGILTHRLALSTILMTLQEALKVKESLQELEATAEKFDWGPSQAFAQQRQEEALRIIKKEIKRLQAE